MDTHEDGTTATQSTSVVRFPVKQRIPRPVTRRHTQPPAEVVELGPVWKGGDNMLSGLRSNSQIIAKCLLSTMCEADVAVDIHRAVQLGIVDAMNEIAKEKIKNGCGND